MFGLAVVVKGTDCGVEPFSTEKVVSQIVPVETTAGRDAAIADMAGVGARGGGEGRV